MARPKPGNYAIGPEGRARYRKAHREWLKKQSELKAKKTPKVTELAKKPVAKKPVAKKPVAKKPVAKKPVAKKPVAKKPVTKKPVAKKVVNKSLKVNKTRNVRTPVYTKKDYGEVKPKYQRKAVYTKENYGNTSKTNKPTPQKTNTTGQTVKNATKKAGKLASDTGKTVVEGTKKLASKVTGKVDNLKKIKQVKSSEPTTGPQKVASKIYRGTKGVLKRGAEAAFGKGNKKGLLQIKNLKGLGKQGVAGLAASGAAHAINKRVDRAFAASKGMTLKEYEKARQSEMGKRGFNRLRPKNIGKTINSLRGKGDNTSTQSSTTTTNKSNNTNKNNKLKVKKDNNSLANQIKVAKKRVRNASGYNKEKLQREVDYLEKFGKQPRTWSNPYGAKGKGKPSTVKTDTTTSKSAKPGSARAKLREKNEARFGKPHVDKLRAKNRDFQAMKKKKLTKKEFIRRYPNSQTAKRARGM